MPAINRANSLILTYPRCDCVIIICTSSSSYSVGVLCALPFLNCYKIVVEFSRK
jgi:hypothetical protein